MAPPESKESCSFIWVMPHSAVAGIELFRTAKLDVWQLSKTLRVWWVFLLLFHEGTLYFFHSTWIMSWSNPTAGKHFYICENLAVGHGENSSGGLYLYRSEREKENFRITVSYQYFECSSCIVHVDVDMGDCSIQLFYLHIFTPPWVGQGFDQCATAIFFFFPMLPVILSEE